MAQAGTHGSSRGPPQQQRGQYVHTAVACGDAGCTLAESRPPTVHPLSSMGLACSAQFTALNPVVSLCRATLCRWRLASDPWATARACSTPSTTWSSSGSSGRRSRRRAGRGPPAARAGAAPAAAAPARPRRRSCPARGRTSACSARLRSGPGCCASWRRPRGGRRTAPSGWGAASGARAVRFASSRRCRETQRVGAAVCKLAVFQATRALLGP